MRIETDSQHYTDIAEAIREMNGTENTYYPEEMAPAVRAIPQIVADEPKVYHADWICTSSSAVGTALTETLDLPAGKYIVICHTPVSIDQTVDWNSGYLFCLYANGSILTDSIGVINRTYGRYTAYIDLSEDSAVTFCTASSTNIPYVQAWNSRGGMDAIQIQPYYNLHKYSLTEQIIGIWVDNKPLYEKTINVPSLPNSNTLEISTPSNIKEVINFSGYAYRTSTGSIRPLPFAAGGTNDIRLDLENHILRVITYADWTAFGAYITVQYTKTSS